MTCLTPVAWLAIIAAACKDAQRGREAGGVGGLRDRIRNLDCFGAEQVPFESRLFGAAQVPLSISVLHKYRVGAEQVP